MFAIPGIVALIAFIYARPQEYVPALETVPLLYIFFFLAIFGALLDLKLSNVKLLSTPMLPWALAFAVWAMLTVLFTAPRTLHLRLLELGISFALFSVVAQGVQSLRMLAVVSGVVVAMVLFVSAIGIHQGFAETGCVLIDESNRGDHATGTFDGRPCQVADECYLGDAEPGGQYLCERIGAFGSHSVNKGRVRWRGVLQDPNELALAAGIGVPLAFAFGARRRKFAHGLFAFLVLAIVLVCAVLTRSRGGQLVLLAVLGAYFLQRFGKKGAIVGAIAAAPLALWGGRRGTEADESSLQRIDAWYEAISMARSNPFYGVGFGQFGEYHYLTAHNSYMLALAELGLPGLFLFSVLMYVSAKVPLVALRRFSGEAGLVLGEHLAPMRAWAMGLLAAFVGLSVGIFFLSFTYHYVLWIYMGLSGALYLAARRHDPEFRVRVGVRDLLLVAVADLALVVGMYVLTRVMLG
jgi:hypothetical protein